MNLNKYFIAFMSLVLMLGNVSAQENRAHSFNNQQEYQVLEEGASGSADYQTKQMTAILGLNFHQAAETKKINLKYAQEIERVKAECGDDLSGLNNYVDKVAFVRDQELKSVLTPQQFAYYTANKSNKTWLGMDKFKVRSGELTVKENKNELKVKGKSSIATEDISASANQNVNKNQFSDAYKNGGNIIIEVPTAAMPDYHNIPKNDAIPSENSNAGAPEIKTNPGGIQIEEVYGLKPEYDVSGQTLKSAPNSDDFNDTTTSAKGLAPSEYGSNVDRFNKRSSEPDRSREHARENYFINKDSKAKFTDNEVKIKPEKSVKYKITDKEVKLKDGKAKLKENDKELKIKDGHREKVKSNVHETKIKDGDLKVKIKE